MGAVYRAEHRLMDRPVALKVIRGDLLGNEAMVERFRREVKAAARLASHPNIVAAYDAEQAGETHMLVMEFIEGTDLARLVDRRGPLPVGEACEYARQAALGLQHAFEDGMVHRDIKPQNLMRTTRGQIKILDFGLARFASEVGSHAGVTAEGMVLGSADYIAPEQIDDPHAADIRADIYSLGCTLYFLLAGQPPFPDGSLIQKLRAHSEKTPRPLAEIRADVPPELARVVERMMAKDPARRFQTPDEVARALAPFADAQAARAAATGLDARPPMPMRDHRCRRAVARLARRRRVRGRPCLAQRHGGLSDHGPRASPRLAAALAADRGGPGPAADHRRVPGPGHVPHPDRDGGIGHRVRGFRHRGDRQAGRQAGHDRRPEDQEPHRAARPGSYELQLAGGGEGLKLSTDTFTLKRGDKTIVTVRREPRAPAPPPKPASDLLAGADTEEVGEIARFQSPHDLTGQAFFLPDGRRILYATGGDNQNNQWVEGTDAALWLGDLADPKNPRKFTGLAPGWIVLARSRDGRLALTASADKTLRLWDVETGKSRRVRREETGLGLVAFSPDERHAAYVCGDTIRLCDLKTGDELRTFRGHTGSIWTFAFCGDGRRLVSGGVDDHTIRVWNVETGEEIRQMRHGDGVTSVAVFPDGRRALTASWDRTIGVWDLETGQQLRRIYGVADRIRCQSRRLARWPPRPVRAHDHAVRLWDLETDEEIERFEGHTGGLLHVAFSPDGRRAVSSARTRRSGSGRCRPAARPARSRPSSRSPISSVTTVASGGGGLPGRTAPPVRLRGRDDDPLGSGDSAGRSVVSGTGAMV